MAEEKKRKKLTKVIEGTVLTITEGITNTVIKVDFAKLPENIKANLGPYGLSQKLGDAAAGKEGQEAVDSIMKIKEGLEKGDWTVRAPAAEKINKKDIVEKFNAMAPQQKAVLAANPELKKTLEALGVKF
ncbi:MAG: hypothetical protein WC261_15030 [Synergistaceae bacterium]|jgi:hypothetical protein